MKVSPSSSMRSVFVCVVLGLLHAFLQQDTAFIWCFQQRRYHDRFPQGEGAVEQTLPRLTLLRVRPCGSPPLLPHEVPHGYWPLPYVSPNRLPNSEQSQNTYRSSWNNELTLICPLGNKTPIQVHLPVTLLVIASLLL